METQRCEWYIIHIQYIYNTYTIIQYIQSCNQTMRPGNSGRSDIPPRRHNGQGPVTIHDRSNTMQPRSSRTINHAVTPGWCHLRYCTAAACAIVCKHTHNRVLYQRVLAQHIYKSSHFCWFLHYSALIIHLLIPYIYHRDVFEIFEIPLWYYPREFITCCNHSTKGSLPQSQHEKT